ncbi:ESPR-type extended signal peptide-containing protein [Veillonella sp.]|uniref:ESPR-type extended signal peptide-containing protein n=1 Tax=Veillonella sp. TaxID=1926307 RepID=UPI00290CF577|nr:ESPR-type extended signal peptide-containing protein [Veillonella sp.]MDU4443296.1 ESPR-type extended signal peptide-containing protein [Veillonella sp.]
MNKIFKVVWSKTKECYVVVSEVAKNNGGKKKVLASLLAGLAMVGAGAQVQAYSGLGGHDNSAVETLAVGPDTWANQEAAVAVGMHNNANGQPAGKHSVAIGSFSNANGEISIAMGGVTNASGKMSVAVGYRASATDEAAVALGNMVSADKNSTGVGPGATASGTYAFAGGYQSETTGISGVAIGDNAKAKAARAMAIGGHAEATAEQAIAIGSDTGAGNKTTASKKNAIAVGHGATASGLDTAAIGTSATASGQSSVALGNGTQSTHLNTTAIGSNVQSTKTGSIGIGGNVESIGDYSVAIGSASAGKTVKAVDYATAVGGLSNAAERAAALGAGANAAQARSVAVGYKATANTADGVAIGSTSVASTAAGVQGFDSAENRTRKYTNLTGNVQTSTLAAVSVGDGTTVTRQITGLAAGKEDTDAVNVAQLKNVGVRVGADTNTATIGTNKVAADFLAYNGQLNIKGDSNRVTTVSENDANGKDANVNIKFDYDGLVKAKTGSAVTVDQKKDAAGKTYFEIDAAAGSKTVVADGKNTTVTGAGTTASPYKVNVEGALTGISSITNNGGGKIEFTTGGTTISGGPVNVSNNKITGVANGDVNATSTDAVNGSQLHAVKAAERHIAPTTTGHEYTVDSNGDVTMTYLDGNNNAVANEKAVIKGIAKQDLSNITNEGKKEITKLGTIVNAGDNVTVTSSSDATTGRTTYTVNAVTPAIYTDKNGNKVVKRPDGTYTTNLDGSTGNDVAANDVIVSFKDAAGNTTGGSSIVNNVGSAIKNQTGATYLDKLDAAAGDTKTQNAAVNVTDLKNTADGLTNKGLRFDANEGNEKTNKLGSKVTVKGTGALTAGKAYADEYNTANIRTNIEQGTDGNTTINVGLAKELKAINSISNGGSSITISNVPTGATTPAVTISGGNLSMGNGTTNNKIVNLAPGTADNDAVNVKQLKDTELHITPGTYTPDANKKVKLTYTDGNNTVVNGKEAVIDLSGLATGGTTSTEKVQKAADATDDKNIAEVGPKSGDTFGAANATYEVSVSRNAVKDAAREAVTINNGGTKSGTTYTPNADNPITVTPKEDAANHNTTYEVTFDGNKAAKQIPLTYKATNGTTTTADQTVKLDKGLNFTGGDYTTASVGADGKVTFDVNLGTAPTVTDGKPGVPGQAGAAGKDGIATVKTVVDTINNSGWKANAKANGGTLDGSSTATVVKPGDQVNFAAGKNLTVKQDLTGEHTYTYSLNKDLKDLTSVEIGGSTIKTDGDHITITSPDTNPGATPGATVTNKVANLGDEKHIKPDTYAVANDGSVTLKYVDGNGKDLTETTKITGIAKKAKVINGKNTTVEEGTDAVDNSTTYKVNVKGDLTGISSITNDGTNNGKISFGPNKTVTVDGDHSITLNASTGKIGGLQNLTFDPTNFTSGQAATEDQLKSVHDTLKANERHIAPTTVATGSTENKGGTTVGTENIYKYDATTKKVTLTYNDGNGHAVTDTKAVIDFSALNTGGTTASTWTAKTSAENTTAGSEVGKHAGDTSQVIGDQNSVDFQAGKNMTVKQTNDGNGNTTINYALDKNLDVESVHVGKDGKDGKIGIDGKDGVDGLDGTNRVDIHVEKGAKGVDGTDGHDGVNGHNGKDGMTRIVYEDKGGKQEVATLNDGMKYAGDDAQGTDKTKVIAKKLNETLDIIGGANKTDLTTDNIGVNNDGNGKLLVQLSKNLNGINTVKNGNTTITLNDAPGGATNTPAVTISGGNLSMDGNKVTNVAPGTDDTDAVNYKQLKAAKTEVKAGENVTVKHTTDGIDNHNIYTVSAVTPAVYTKADGTKVYKIVDPTTGAVTWNTNPDGTGTNVNAGDVITSFETPANGTTPGSTTGGTMIVNNVGSAINGKTGATYLDKLDAAAGDNNTKHAAVNVTDLKSTADALKSNELHIRPTTSGRTGETVNQGTGGTAESYKYDAATKSVTLKYNDGTGAGVTGTEAKIDLSDLANQITSGYTFKANATANGGTVANDATAPAVATTVENGGTINYAAGKNLTVKQDIDATAKTHTYTYSLNKDLTNLDKVVVNGENGTNGKDGVTIVGPQGATGATGIPGTNGIDGKVGIAGKDGKDAVSISGKDGVGHIGLQGPKGTPGTPGADGASLDITTDHGTQTLTKPEANNGGKSERIVYVPKDANGNPLKDTDGNDIKREVATMDDGLKFAGDDGQANQATNANVIKKQLNNVVDIIGGATKADLTTNNIGVNNDGNGKLLVQLSKNLNGINTIKNGGTTITLNDTPGGTNNTPAVTISGGNLSMGDSTTKNKIVNLAPGTDDNDAVNVKQLKDAKTVLADGKNTKKSGTGTATDPYKVNVEGDLTEITSITNKADASGNAGKITFSPNQIITVDGDHSITLNASTGKIGGLQNKTFDPTNFTSGQAATEDQLKSVHDTLKANERHIAPTTVATGSTETKGGTANAGGTANVYKYDAASKTVTLTYNDGNGHAVTDTKAVIDLSNLSTGGTGASSWNVKSSANTTDGGAVDANHNANAQNIADGKSVEFQSGKNLVVKQTNDTTNGNATVEFSLSDNITVGKDGANGKDGSVGAKGADGSAVVMNGKDGSIGLNGTNGANGISIKGKDGANGVGIDGKDGVTRIVYTEKVPDPANPGTTKEVTHEVATMDDGLKFTGNNTATENKRKLGSLLKVQGEDVSAADEAAFQSAGGNIAVTANGSDTLTIRLNKNLKGLNSIQLGGNTIQSNGDNITFTTNGGTTKTVATTDQLWTIQAGGVDVPAKSGKVNLVAGDHITITPDAANGKMTISATGFGSMDGFNVKTSAESATVGTHAGDTTANIKNGKTVDMQAGKNLVVTQTNDGSGNTTVNYALNKDVDLGTNGSLKTGDTTINNDGFKNGNTTVGGNGMTIKDPTDPTKTVSLTKDGLNNGGNQITNVASGGNVDTNAANIGDIKRLAKDTRIKDGTYTVDNNGTVELTYVDGAGNQVKDASGNAITAKITGLTTLDSTRVNVAVNETGSGKAVGSKAAVKVTKGTEFVAGDNLIVERKANAGTDVDNSVVYSLNKDLKGIETIKNGNTTITLHNNPTTATDPTAVTITGGNINMGGNRIVNVAPAKDGTDAVNLDQLKAARTKVTSNDGTVTIRSTEDKTTGQMTYDLHVTPGQSPDLTRITNKVDQLGEEIGRVGAQGAALSALKPIQYDPLEPTQIMAGYGNYRGNSAVALGVAHYKNESTLIHGGVSWAGGSSHMMANAGVTWKVGNRDSEAAVADRYRKGPISSAYAMQQEMAAMKAQNAGLKGEVSDLKAENEQMKAQIAAMMAKLGL